MQGVVLFAEPTAEEHYNKRREIQGEKKMEMKEIKLLATTVMLIVHGVIGIVVLSTGRPGYPDKSLGGFLCTTAIFLVLLIIAECLEDEG